TRAERRAPGSAGRGATASAADAQSLLIVISVSSFWPDLFRPSTGPVQIETGAAEGVDHRDEPGDERSQVEGGKMRIVITGGDGFFLRRGGAELLERGDVDELILFFKSPPPPPLPRGKRLRLISPGHAPPPAGR